MCHNPSMRVGAAVFGVCALFGCGGDDPENWTPGRPRIDAAVFVGQTPAAPLGLQFGLTFVDSDGDLGGGRLDLEVGGQAAGGLALAELFDAQTPAVASDATSGELEVLVRLDEMPAGGAQVRLGFVLEDAAGHRSNQPTVTLEAISAQSGSLTFQAPGGGG